jgi:hypothetical protein
MENILAALYLTGVFFTAFVFLFFYVNEFIDRKRNRRKTAGNEPVQISEPVGNIVGKSKTAFFALDNQRNFCVECEYWGQSQRNADDTDNTDLHR